MDYKKWNSPSALLAAKIKVHNYESLPFIDIKEYT